VRKLVLGDYDSLMGIGKPSKIEWLITNGVENIEGVQIISLATDTFHERLFALAEKFPFLKRVSVALNCWPLITTKENNINVDVAATTFLDADRYCYALSILKALHYLHEKTGLQVDISYHPMLTWPRFFFEQDWNRRLQSALYIQNKLWEWEIQRRKEFRDLVFRGGEFGKLSPVGISIENEPTTSDQQANLLHSGNRLFSEMINGLSYGWGVTADLQHLGMALACLQGKDMHPLSIYRKLTTVGEQIRYLEEQQQGLGHQLIFPPFMPSGSHNPDLWTWEAQFHCLRDVMGPITFHVAQVEDPLRHITPPIRWNDPIMPWPLILRLMQELDEKRGGNIWYAVEIDGGHLYPGGYHDDLDALLQLQEVFGK